uniref:BHLH domain-containing protein n=1 Tax=Glossina palpalis gambiensis TaxID=67801 RepID=A0A1B0AQ65_9MUSC
MLAFRPMMPIWVKKTAAKILLKERKAIISKMKSLTAVCQTGASMPAINPNGRINRHPPHRGDGENAEMKMYLSKLKDLVPFMPKNRKLSKLEIIQHVIDYICDLQTELETHPEINNFDATAALNFNNNNNINNNNNNNNNNSSMERVINGTARQDHQNATTGEIQQRLNGDSQQQQQQQQTQQSSQLIQQQSNSFSLINYLLVFDQNTYFANRVNKH